MSEESRIVVVLEDGMVQDVYTVGAPHVDVVLIDYDTEGCDENCLTEHATNVPQDEDDGGGTAPAFVSRWGANTLSPVAEQIATMLRDMFGTEVDA